MYRKLIFIILLMSPLLSCFAGYKTKAPVQIITQISKDFPGDRIAKSNDFLPYLQKMISELPNKYVCTISHDLSGDGIDDYALLLINKNKKYFQFVVYSSSNNFDKPFILSRTFWPTEYNGKIWQLMWLKKAGSNGMSKEEYFNAPKKNYPYTIGFTEKDHYEYQSAINRYKNMAVIEKTDTAYDFFDPEDIFYCKSSFYFESAENMFMELSKCD